ncbi:ATP-dependent DNA helicase Q-like 5, partial [Cucurbita argyrosperma subsp. argyrosperma]
MNSDSDSDSDASHISATPPRDSNPRPPPSSSVTPFTSAFNAKCKFSKATSSLARTRSKPGKHSSRVAKPSPPPDTKPSEEESLPDWTPLPTLPYQIRRASDQSRGVSSSESIEMLPAGFFSKSSSFLKFRGSCLNFETSEDNRPLSELSQQNNVETEVAGCSTADWGSKDNSFIPGNPVKLVRKYPNLIGAHVPAPPVKVRKCGGEGNFVKLNLNGRKRKFIKKFNRRKYGERSSYRSHRRTKMNLKNEDCHETASFCDEDGLVTETTQHPQKQGNGGAKFDPVSIEETLSNVRNDPSDDNLVQLLKLAYGYDSFQEGQLETIKMVLAGKSTMVVLPTGAGKSICYQIPAMVLPGITVVVSPLVALMIDQIKQLPPVIQGGLLCSSQRPDEVSEIVRLLIQGSMKCFSIFINRLDNFVKLLVSHDCFSALILQLETDSVSRYLCDNGISAKSYHSGLPAKDRKHIQENFCSNKIRVVVATVAFGMGLNKRDVGAVIHYSMPESLEEYIQEIGRAGRDGRLSYCHLFLDNDTYFKLRSLMHSDGVDEYNINKFISEVFSENNNSCGKVYSMVKDPASRKFDMKEEVMITILTYLELGEMQYLRLLPQLNVTCILNFHKTSPAMLADKDIIVAEILKKSETKQGQHVFDMLTVVNSIGISATSLSNHLQNLKLKGEITYEMKDLAYCYTILKYPEDFCSLSAHLRKWLSEIQTSKVRKLDAMFDAVTSAVNFPFLRADIKVFLQSNSQAKFTPRAVARIMHGISSPAYPSTIWSRTHFWGRYTQVDFSVIMEAATLELLNFVGKDVVS